MLFFPLPPPSSVQLSLWDWKRIHFPWANFWVCSGPTLVWYGGSVAWGTHFCGSLALATAEAFRALFGSRGFPVSSFCCWDYPLEITMMFWFFPPGSLDFFHRCCKTWRSDPSSIQSSALGSLVCSLSYVVTPLAVNLASWQPSGPQLSIFPPVHIVTLCDLGNFLYSRSQARVSSPHAILCLLRSSMFAREHATRQSVPALSLHWYFPQTLLNCCHVCSFSVLLNTGLLSEARDHYGLHLEKKDANPLPWDFPKLSDLSFWP